MNLLRSPGAPARERFESARTWFLEKIERQAREEGQPITEAQRQFLVRSADVQGKEYRSLWEGIGGDNGYDALLERCATLVMRSMERDKASDPAAPEVYARRMNELGSEDAFWTFMVYAGVRRKRASVLGRVLQLAFAFAGIVIVSALARLVIGIARRSLNR